jgi:hemolysin activation/secretion protein
VFTSILKSSLCIAILSAIAISHTSVAQVPPTLPDADFQRPPTAPQPVPVPILPPVEEFLPTTPPANLPSQPIVPGNTQKIVVKRFTIDGSTVFTPAELDRLTSKYTNRPLEFAELLQVADEITQLYVRQGYINSGAYIPGNQSFAVSGGTIAIRVIEGRVTDIVVTGTRRLDPNYIKSRIGLGTGKVLKIDRLIDSLRLLQLDPLIKTISTELVSGQQTGTSILQIKVTEAPPWQTNIVLANNRTPSVGEIQTQAAIAYNNFSGLGDSIGIGYGRSEASNIAEINYTLPLNPNNGTLRFQYGNSNSRVIEAPFDRLDIQSYGRDISVTYRQPLFRTPAEEFAIGVTLARRDTNTTYTPLGGERFGYPTPGADADGSTRVSAARLFQDYVIKDTRQVFAARSQLSLGINAFDATNNPSSPDSKFVTWRGQAQYVRALAPNSLFLVRLESQIADRPLLAIEQLGIGGQDSVRGYRQDLLLTDNGIIASAEVRLPIFTPPTSQQVLQIVPFLDFGWGWNRSSSTNDSTRNVLAAGGLGLRYQSADFSAKLDYGIPFSSIDLNKRTGQERGFYFSINYNRSF